jgi:glycosyltransferase involved in cell wall biosynthesis
MKLTIGMPCFNNFTETWFTIQALRLNHDLTDCEILIVDNFGDKKLEEFAKSWGNGKVRYELFKDVVGTSEVRNKVFDLAHGEMVLCMDSHVMIKPGALKNIPITDDLIHGPLLMDDLKNYTCEWLPVWRDNMWGIWGNCVQAIPEHPNIKKLPDKPFEIWGAGLGIFLAKQSSWLRFNSKFRGFGGEEGYIHEKYRKAGRKVWCYPDLVWMHLFKKSIPYPLRMVDRVRNYLIGFEELGLDKKPLIDHFKEPIILEAQKLMEVKKPIVRTTIKNKISCVMTTYRRFTCVERSISMFLNQDYKGESELIIYNTDVEHPLQLGESLKNKNIQIFNCNIDSFTTQSYTNIGAIRRDALEKATGEYYICWDDDDIFLPWNNCQGFEGIQRQRTKAFKPQRSFFARRTGIELAQNTMEASVTVLVSEVVYDLKTGSEHLPWYVKLRDAKQLNENSTDSVPSYSFNWGDPPELAGHKQSGSINNPNNFENHKRETKDFAKRPLEKIDVNVIYKPYYDFLREHRTEFNQEYFNKYVLAYLS